MADWREDLDTVDARLVDEYQSGFPVEVNPFEAVAHDLGITADEALARVERLRERGVFRRFGAVLNPPVIGSSTLAALSVPEDRFDAVADVVNSYRQVNHNYRRNHDWNMWFVVTASSREKRDGILADIEARTGLDVLVLPLVTDYYINLEFPVVNGDEFVRESTGNTRVEPTPVSEDAMTDLTPLEARVLLAIQDGLPLSATPYADVADAVSRDATTDGASRPGTALHASTEDVVDTIAGLLDRNCIKRVGCVVNHVVTGFDANCMVVWDVPGDELDERATRVGALPHVTLCYNRPRRPDQDWPYNLFTMIHGREQDAVDACIDDLAENYLPVPHERLYSTATLKQTGARYDDLLDSPAPRP
ncbi:siroheme decarboxylase subunit beta [Halocalculus aciditolerans]|uniref:siroheme decarboxylase n=1 Tax=Halocalculus aciditolerans TaxID=1383812 RepID=A0A830FIF8_9EURY|nr:Lrp/AsnC family transcriptional regulator [Halocalculus aciditolerans]GGL50412.1 heme biosynthesis protein [Halocalculus aciditolerans]